MGETMMVRAGVPEGDAVIVVADSRRAEVYVALAYGGTTLEPGNPVGDVELPIGGWRVWNVKSVPDPRARFVNGGEHRPVCDVIVVSRKPWTVLGMIRREQWAYGVPVVPGRRAQACWNVPRAAVLPAPPRRMVVGYDDPALYEMTWDDLLHADWNDRGRRRRARETEGQPEPLPGIGERQAHPTGLALRSGHAPGKDNWRRRRP